MWFDVSPVKPRLGLVALVLVAAGVSRCQLAGSLRRAPRAGLSGVRTLAAGSRAGPKARGSGLARPP
jgi:hypothetical protein